MTGKGDWPNQAVYMRKLLAALASPSTCLDTTVAADTVACVLSFCLVMPGHTCRCDTIDTQSLLFTLRWLNPSAAGGSGFFGTWDVFQVQYYDMPRLPGKRIESPDTLVSCAAICLGVSCLK